MKQNNYYYNKIGFSLLYLSGAFSVIAVKWLFKNQKIVVFKTSDPDLALQIIPILSQEAIRNEKRINISISVDNKNINYEIEPSAPGYTKN